MQTEAAGAAPSVIPFLRYADAHAALEWLERAFGFRRVDACTAPDGTLSHAELAFGSGMVMLGAAKDDHLRMRTPRELGAVSQGIYVHVPQVDEHYRRVAAAGAEIVKGLTEMDYGLREYTARDPEGNLWSFGTYAPSPEGARG